MVWSPTLLKSTMNSSTNKIKSRYKAGELIKVRVVEYISGQSWIVSLQGSLIQVRNRSQQSFKVGEEIMVKVESVDPAVLTII
jgi:uncharacterized Fe-S cluster-containing radical SAM superfamily enzyme